jgi:hypothetical protein
MVERIACSPIRKRKMGEMANPVGTASADLSEPRSQRKGHAINVSTSMSDYIRA